MTTSEVLGIISNVNSLLTGMMIADMDEIIETRVMMIIKIAVMITGLRGQIKTLIEIATMTEIEITEIDLTEVATTTGEVEEVLDSRRIEKKIRDVDRLQTMKSIIEVMQSGN